MAAFGPKVSIWEVGNEVNGNWLGPVGRVVQDIQGAYNVVTRAGGQTALTQTYQPGCAGDPAHDMWTWAARHIPVAMKQGPLPAQPAMARASRHCALASTR
jgi:hypothetical protein